MLEMVDVEIRGSASAYSCMICVRGEATGGVSAAPKMDGQMSMPSGGTGPLPWSSDGATPASVAKLTYLRTPQQTQADLQRTHSVLIGLSSYESVKCCQSST